MKKGKRVLLRPFEQKDASFIVKVNNDAKLQGLALCRALNLSEATVEEWIKKKRNCVFFVIESIEEKIPIGHVQLNLVQQRTCGKFKIIIDWDYQSKGFGTEVISLMIEYARDVLKLKKLMRYGDVNNHKATGLYKKLNFKELKILKRAVFFNKEYKDLIKMELIL